MAYPVEDYNYLFNGGKTVEVFAGVAITCCDHFFIITKEIRTDLIEKVEQFHLVPVKFSYS
ncbi:hypothetical protein NI447_10330 [Enterococcus lactis]|nr:hypothetical protein [Enterococcus lactis]